MRTNAKYFMMFLMCIFTTNAVIAQNEKKFKIVMDLDENGKHINIDTTFSNQADFKIFMKENGLDEPDIEVITGLPDLETLKLELEGLELSDEDLDKLKNELKQTKMEIHQVTKEMKQKKKELDAANEELNKIWVEIEESDENGEKIIIERIHEGDPEDAGKMIFIHKDGDDMKNVHILKVPCDTEFDGNHERVIIKKIESAEHGGNTNRIEEELSSENMNFEKSTKKDANESSVTDYRLNVSDFKLFPNPTNNKVTVSFQLTTPGTVEIRLLDTSGRLIADANLQSESGFISKEFNIEGNARGTYLLQIKQGNKWRHEKVVLK